MRWVPVCALAALLLVGCAGRQSAGGGEDTDACAGYTEYQGLAQPVPSDAGEVREFADAFLRIMERVQLDERIVDREGDDVAVDAEVAKAYNTLEDTVKVLRDKVREADGDPAKVRAAVAEITDSDAFASADRVISDFHATVCNAGYGIG